MFASGPKNSLVSLPEKKSDKPTITKPQFTWWTSFTGLGLNPHLTQNKGLFQFLAASFQTNGIGRMVEKQLAEAKKKGDFAAQTFLLHKPIFSIASVPLAQQLLKFNGLGNKLFDGETGGVQEKFFGPKTLVSLPTGTEHEQKKTLLQKHIFLPATIRNVSHEIQNSFDKYLTLFTESNGGNVDMLDTAQLLSISSIATRLGFDVFSEEDKREIAHIVHNIVSRIPNPMNSGLLILEHAINYTFKSKMSLTWHLDSWAKKGEAIIKKVIDDNQASVLEKMKELMGNDKLIVTDLYKEEVLSIIKLVLIGGFETTTKLLFFSMQMLAIHNNSEFVIKLKQEILKNIEALGKNPDKWNSEDVENLNYLNAFIFEVLRLYPPFSHARYTVIDNLTLAPSIPLCANRKEYEEKFTDVNRDRSKDIFVPKGSIVINSVFQAHRDEAIYKDADTFNPNRFLNKEFMGKPLNIRIINTRPEFLTFGIDHRVCPGRMFALHEALFLLPRIMADFAMVPTSKFPKLNIGFTLELEEGEKATVSFKKITLAEQLKTLKEKNSPRFFSAVSEVKSTESSTLSLRV